MKFHVNRIRIFKANHSKSPINKILRGFFVFQVTNIHKTDMKIMGMKTKVVEFDNISVPDIQIWLLHFVLKSVRDSTLFSPLTCVDLAKEITEKIRSRFDFSRSCDILITLNIDQLSEVSGSEIDDGGWKCGGFDDSFDEIEGYEYSEITGLAEVKLKNLESESEDRCSICLEEYFPESRIVKAESSVCSHMFHRDCIVPWLWKFSNSCPLCRAVFIATV